MTRRSAVLLIAAAVVVAAVGGADDGDDPDRSTLHVWRHRDRVTADERGRVTITDAPVLILTHPAS